MAVPAWKLALQERKKKQEEEEKLKKAKEEEQKLASLPAWKRAILMREKKGAEPGAPAAGPAGGSSDVSSSFSSQQNNGPVKPSTEKWQVAVERVKGPDSPLLSKRAPPSPMQKASPSTPTSTSASEQTRNPAPKTVLNRWAGAREAASPKASPTVKRSATFGGTSSISSNRISSPASKRPTANAQNNSPVNKRPTANAHSSSPVIKRPTANAHSSSPVNKRPTANAHSSSPVSKRAPPSSNSTGSSVSKLNATSKWSKDALSSSKPSANSSKSSASSSSVASKSNSQARKEEDDPTLMHLPPWKRALIRKKRESQQHLEVESKPAAGEDETDSGSVESVATNNASGGRSTGAETGSSTVVYKQPVPEVVNRQADKGQADQRLVEQEGKTLHPPIYKEVDQWANVTEEDEKFLSLPPWKQALIKRRRADIANRSGKPVTVTPTPPKEAIQTQGKTPATGKVPANSSNDTKDISSKKTMGTSAKTVKKQSGTKGTDNKRNKSHLVPSTKKTNEQSAAKTRPSSGSKTRPGSGQKPVRKAPAIPAAKKEEKPEPMFSYNFSHRSLDTGGGSSSDSTDSDLEDAVVTNLDGDSDESDSGIVLTSFSTSSSDTKKNNEPKRSSSILSVPGKKKNTKMRRVSWSDSQLTFEHVYPKYDYSDYEEVEQPTTSEESSEFSHRLHPSLLPPSDGDPYTAGFTPPGYSQGGSLSNFVPSSLSPSVMEDNYEFSFQEEPKEEEASSNSAGADSVPPAEPDYSHYYSDQSSNTAALLW